MEYYDGLIGDVGEPLAGRIPEYGPGSRSRRSAVNLEEPSVPAMSAVVSQYNDLPDEIWTPVTERKLVILDDIEQGNWEKIQEIKRPLPAKQSYPAPEEQPKVPSLKDYDRCLHNMECITDFHDARIKKPTPNEDLGKELEALSEHPRILPHEEADETQFRTHVSKIRKYQYPVDCMVAKPMTKKDIRNDKNRKSAGSNEKRME